MLSSNGISWRQGPHQLAQKLIITTWPLYCARLTWLPAREPRLKAGAGPPSEPASAGSDSASAAAMATIWFFMMRPLEKDGRTDARLKVVGELGGAQQARLEHAILDRDVHCQPVRRHHTVSGAKVHRELRVPGEIGTADAAEEIESARHGDAATEKGLARQEVVAEREVVVREAPLILGEQLQVSAEGLEAGAAGLGTPELGLEEEVLGDVVGGGDAVHRVGAEVLDRQLAVVQAQLHVAAADLGHRDLAPCHLRLDHARRRRLVLGLLGDLRIGGG